MVNCEDLAKIFQKNGLNFFSGVPDSTFKGWTSFLDQNPDLEHIIAVNECEAISMAAGYHLATGKIGVVYMQNSGEGDIVNPLTSLCDREVYSIPLIMMIGWRGEPGKKDEPQHKKMGKMTLELLDVLGVPYKVIQESLSEVEKSISELEGIARRENIPVAMIIQEGLIEDYTAGKESMKLEMNREAAIKRIVDNISDKDIVISTTGKTSRELFEYRRLKGQATMDFYTVGSMGCSSSIGFLVARKKPEQRVFVFDGDGAALMQLGSFATIGHYKPKNFYHIIFDNNSYDSTGGQPTVSETVDFEKIALACGYKHTKTVEKSSELESFIKNIDSHRGPTLLVIKVNKGSRKDLGRPDKTPIENKKMFMDFLKSLKS